MASAMRGRSRRSSAMQRATSVPMLMGVSSGSAAALRLSPRASACTRTASVWPCHASRELSNSHASVPKANTSVERLAAAARAVRLAYISGAMYE